jgi:FAD/FMN-containing dehydrogenase
MSLDRRDFLRRTGILALWAARPPSAAPEAGEWVNDVHSQLNRTQVAEVLKPSSVDELQEAVALAARTGRRIALSGSRHAMGGQQFLGDALLIDSRSLHRIGQVDRSRGTVEIEGGAEWSEIVPHLVQAQAGAEAAWGIAQKQTGADHLTIGGAVSANAHGRGLRMKPFISDLESFTLIDADGRERRCSRQENEELFRLAAGGYGLFGAVARVTLRLAPRVKLERIVEIGLVDDLVERIEERSDAGFLYGDFQYAIDPASDDFLRRGVFCCYRPVHASTPMADVQKELSAQDWGDLVRLAHTDRTRAFERYASYYRSTAGQLYWSDTHQLSAYYPDYHRALDGTLGGPATEMLTELYVPRAALASFMDDARKALRASGVDVVYGTIRFIEKDEESFLAWARDRYACVIFNLHTRHTPDGVERAAAAFRSLIDLAITRGGSYYLTYHRWARRDQVLACYPQLPELLRRKKAHDPEERFQSDWYRHYSALLA